MSENSKIEWTDGTGGPWLGCTEVSPGCANCYARELMERRLFPIMRKAYRAAGFADWETRPVWGDKAPRVVTKGFWDSARSLDRKSAKDGVRRKMFPSMIDWLDECPAGMITQDGERVQPSKVRFDFLSLIYETPNLDWLLLTKRPENFEGLVDEAFEHHPRGDTWQSLWTQGEEPDNVWIGTTVEDQKRADERIPELLKIPAKVRFLSVEPMLEAIDLRNICHQTQHEGYSSFGNFWDYNCENHCSWRGFEDELIPDPEQSEDDQSQCGTRWVCPKCLSDSALVERSDDTPKIHWVINGGESGPKKRPIQLDWMRSLRDQCQAAGVPYFAKQMDKVQPIPDDLMIRQFPNV